MSPEYTKTYSKNKWAQIQNNNHDDNPLVSNPFFLLVFNFYAKKNITTLLETYNELRLIDPYQAHVFIVESKRYLPKEERTADNLFKIYTKIEETVTQKHKKLELHDSHFLESPQEKDKFRELCASGNAEK
jgi:hypothetical protein